MNTIHSARVTTPIAYLAAPARRKKIPIGPCLIEGIGGLSIDIFWGKHGQRSATLPVGVFEAAQKNGCLVLLD